MAGKLIDKLEVKRTFKVTGTLNSEYLHEGVLLIELEDEGEVNLVDYIKSFDGQYVTLNVTNKTEQDVESSEEN